MNPSTLTASAFEAHIDEARAAAAKSRGAGSGRFARRGRSPAGGGAAQEVVIRFATQRDDARLARLAALDSGRAPSGETLIAEMAGEIVAALPLRGRRPLADPFRPTADVVRLLELRAAQLAAADEPAAGGAGIAAPGSAPVMRRAV